MHGRKKKKGFLKLVFFNFDLFSGFVSKYKIKINWKKNKKKKRKFGEDESWVHSFFVFFWKVIVLMTLNSDTTQVGSNYKKNKEAFHLFNLFFVVFFCCEAPTKK